MIKQMKHLAQIQSEFFKVASITKIALEWDDVSYNQQKQYLRDHPLSKRTLTAIRDNVTNKDTKGHFLQGLQSWVDHEKYHKKLAIVVSNFMHKYLPEEFRVTTFDEDLGRVPDYDDVVQKFGLTKYLDEQSGDDIEESTAVIDEKSETTSKRLSGGEFLKIRIATGIHEGKRVIVEDYERYGLAPVIQDGKEIRKQPYGSHGLQVIVSK